MGDGKLPRAMNRHLKKFPIVLAALAVLALVAAGCGSKSSSEEQSPQVALQQALEKTSTIKSGHAELSGSLSVGTVPGSIGLKGGGPFDTEAANGGAVQIDLTMEIAGSEQHLGFAYVDGKQYMLVGDKAIEQKSAKGAKSSGTGQIAETIKNLGNYLSNVQRTAPNTYTAKVDVKKLFQDTSKKSGGASDLEIPGLGGADRLAKTMGSADMTVAVNSDGYADSIDLNMSITAGASGGGEGGLRLKVKLSEINEPQKVEKPKNVVSGADALGSLGSSMLGQ